MGYCIERDSRYVTDHEGLKSEVWGLWWMENGDSLILDERLEEDDGDSIMLVGYVFDFDTGLEIVSAMERVRVGDAEDYETVDDYRYDDDSEEEGLPDWEYYVD